MERSVAAKGGAGHRSARTRYESWLLAARECLTGSLRAGLLPGSSLEAKMRWWLLGAVLLGCNGPDVPTGDSDTADTGPVDTDPPVIIQWVDRTVETSTTLTSVYSGGRGATVIGEDGKAWQLAEGRPALLTTGTEADLTGLWGRGDQSTVELIAVGYAGTVLTWNGSAFDRSEDAALGTTNFEDVDGVPSDLTAVSATGIYRFDGSEWAFESNAFSRSLRRVYVDSAGTAWGVGDNGTIVRRVNDVWTLVPAPSGVDLRDVHGYADEVWIVGNRGTVLRWDGSQLVKVETDSSVNFQGVWVAPSTNNVYVVGNNGAAIMWDPDLPPDEDDTDNPEPGGFVDLPTGADSNLYAVFGSDEMNIWAVGNRGAVYRYTGPRTE